MNRGGRRACVVDNPPIANQGYSGWASTTHVAAIFEMFTNNGWVELFRFQGCQYAITHVTFHELTIPQRIFRPAIH